MLLLDWYRQWKEIRRENNRENELIETLKHEIEMLRLERDRLLSRILNVNQETAKSVDTTEFKPIPTSRMPWAVQRQMLEREDRAKAKLLRNKEIEGKDIKIDELEKEMDIVEKERSS